MKLDLQMLRYRAASSMSLCSGHHDIKRSDNGDQVWVECDGKELNRLYLEEWVRNDRDPAHEIQLFIRETLFEHEQDVVGKVVIELLNRLEPKTADLNVVQVNMGPPRTYEQGFDEGLQAGRSGW